MSDLETTINNVKIHYKVFVPPQRDPVSGGREVTPFLFLHGWGSNSDRWAPIAEEVSRKGFRVIVPDLPGFGKSDALLTPWNTNKYIDFIEQFAKELNVVDFYLLGHSFGGALASKIAVKHVQEVKKLFLISAACVREKTAKKSFLKKIAKIVKLFYFLPYYAFIRKAVYKFVIRKSDYVYVEGTMKQTYLNVVAEDLSFHLPFIKVPTVIIWGEKDDFTPIADAHLINEKIKNSKLIVIPGAGHDLNRKQPEALVEAVLQNI